MKHEKKLNHRFPKTTKKKRQINEFPKKTNEKQ